MVSYKLDDSKCQPSTKIDQFTNDAFIEKYDIFNEEKCDEDVTLQVTCCEYEDGDSFVGNPSSNPTSISIKKENGMYRHPSRAKIDLNENNKDMTLKFKLKNYSCQHTNITNEIIDKQDSCYLPNIFSGYYDLASDSDLDKKFKDGQLDLATTEISVYKVTYL